MQNIKVPNYQICRACASEHSNWALEVTCVCPAVKFSPELRNLCTAMVSVPLQVKELFRSMRVEYYALELDVTGE